MGADTGIGERRRAESIFIRLAAGAYRIDAPALLRGVNIEGEGQENTMLESTVLSLMTHSSLTDVTIAGSIRVDYSEAPRIVRCTITAPGYGVQCYYYAAPELIECTISGNRSNSSTYPLEGGGVFCGPNTKAILTDCVISQNYALDEGGGVFCASRASPILTRCTISGNRAGWGPGALSGSGGGLSCDSSATPTLTDCTIAMNVAWGVDGLTLGSGTATRCTISRNAGLGVSVNGEGTLTDCVISDNLEGGVSATGSATLQCCRITANGGVGLSWSPWDDSSVRVTNCVIAANARGGVNSTGPSATLTGCTITANAASDEAGVRCAGDSGAGGELPILVNCIVWGNTPESLCGQTDHCLSEVDPLFVAPGVIDFARFTKVDIYGKEHEVPDFIVEEPDYRLLPGSPAIDAGTSEGAPLTDIEGTLRHCGAGVDIGAYESGECGAPFRRGDANADAGISIGDAIFILQALFARGREISCPDAADANDDEAMDLADAIYLLQFLFAQGPAIPPPYPACGPDPTTNPDPTGPDLPVCMYERAHCGR
jgi:hypothetical protein